VNEALYEADKALEKFAAAPRECACLQYGGELRCKSLSKYAARP